MLFIFFFNVRAPTEIYPLPLPDALPISARGAAREHRPSGQSPAVRRPQVPAIRALLPSRGAHAEPQGPAAPDRSEEHTSELQSRQYLVCRLLLEKKKTE